MHKKPLFICIGVQKSGTTSLHDILNQHPDLCLPLKKETHFFSNEELYRKGKEFYFGFFDGLDRYKYFGEIDPEYTFNIDSAKRIYEMFGETKIVIMLRNPVERAYSHYLMTKRRSLEKFGFEKAISLEEKRIKSKDGKFHHSYISRGLYLEQISTFEKYFGIENIKVVIFEDFIKETASHINEIANFIDLPLFEYDYNKKSNPSSRPRLKFIQRFIYGNNKIKNVFGNLISSRDYKRRLMQRIEKMNLKKENKEPLKFETKQKLYETYFKAEIIELEKKLK